MPYALEELPEGKYEAGEVRQRNGNLSIYCFCLAADMPEQNCRKDGVDMGTLIICKTRASTLFIYLFVFFNELYIFLQSPIFLPSLYSPLPYSSLPGDLVALLLCPCQVCWGPW